MDIQHSFISSVGTVSATTWPGYELVTRADDTYVFARCADVSNANAMKKCEKGCVTCKFIGDGYVKSKTTGNMYKPNIPVNSRVDCTTQRVVYCITCTACGFQYVGETKRSIHRRFSEHRYSINKGHTILARHFRSAHHSADNMRVTVLEVVEEEKLLKEREDFWIRQLLTAHPFGLNDKVRGYGNVGSYGSGEYKTRNHPYFSQPLPRRTRGRGRKRRRSKRQPIDVFNALSAVYDNGNLKDLYTKLRSLNLKELKVLKQELCLGGGDGELSLLLQCYVLSLRYQQLHKRVDKSKEFVKFAYPNRGAEMINLHNVLKDKSLLRLFPADCLADDTVLSSVYTLDSPLSRQLYNYSKVLKRLSLDQLKVATNGPCECAGSAFIYRPVSHIMTGDTAFVQQNNIRQFFEKGAKYRVQKMINWNEVRDCAHNGVTELIRRKCQKYNKLPIVFSAFGERFMQIVDNRIRYFCKGVEVGQVITENMLRFTTECEVYVKQLQRNYVIVPADKATNNYVFVCKKFYLLEIARELGVRYDMGSDCWRCDGNITYKASNEQEIDILDRHTRIATSFKTSITEEDRQIPILFATAKMHKTPHKFRFIAGAKKSSTKSISTLVHIILQHFRTHLKAYCTASKHNNGISSFWSIAKSMDVVDQLSKAGTRRNDNAKLISVDFSTLFTSLPHAVIYRNLFMLIDVLFKNSGKQFMAASIFRRKAFYTNETKFRGYTYLSATDIKTLVQAVVSETYVKFGGVILKQVCGIPMGGCASPMIADLTLAAMEFDFLKKSANVDLANSVYSAYRYIDDLLLVTTANYETILKSIYPPELTPSRTNSHDNECDFLDLAINSADRYVFKVYDKTEDFDFLVTKFVFADSNVPTSLGYDVFYAQLVRHARITTSSAEFMRKIKAMHAVLIRHGFKKRVLVSTFIRFACRHQMLLFKYRVISKLDLLRAVRFIFL